MGRKAARREVAGRPAPYGTCPNAGERVGGPERYAGEVEPIDIMERAVEGPPPDKAHGLGRVPGYCPGAGKKDDIDAGPGKADSCAHRSVSGHWRSK